MAVVEKPVILRYSKIVVFIECETQLKILSSHNVTGAVCTTETTW